jgi:predicted nucleic-acid-binding protein
VGEDEAFEWPETAAVIGLDTNILVRYILDDDPKWSPMAAQFMEQRLSPARPGYINLIVLAELVWTLSKAKHASRHGIAELVRDLLQSEVIVVERREVVERALGRFAQGGAGLADYLIGELNVEAKASPT